MTTPDEVRYEVTIKVNVGWKRDDCGTDEEWEELRSRVETYDEANFADAVEAGYDTVDGLLNASNVEFRRL